MLAFNLPTAFSHRKPYVHIILGFSEHFSEKDSLSNYTISGVIRVWSYCLQMNDFRGKELTATDEKEKLGSHGHGTSSHSSTSSPRQNNWVAFLLPEKPLHIV